MLYKKDLYVTLQATLLFWKLLSEKLKKWGLYERCVSHNNIKSKQFTIIWHVDRLKVSHIKKM